MSNIGNVNVNELHRYITKVAQKELNSSHVFDTVITGTVNESLPGYYTVSLTNGGDTSTINALPMSSTDTWTKGDYVYLIKAPVASGDTHQVKYYVFGLVSDTQETFANATEWERFQAEGSSQTLNEIDFSDFLTNIEIKEKQIKVINDSTFILDVKNLGAFALNGSFTFVNNNQNSITNYGLRVKLLTAEGAVSKLNTGEDAIFDLDTTYFIGQPFNMDDVNQKRVFTLEEDINFTQIAIYIFIEGELNVALTTNQIEVKNVSIQAGSLLDISGRFSIKLNPLSGYKDYFRSGTVNTVGVDTIGLGAIAYYDSQPLSADSIQYYWVITDNSITSNSNQYLSLAGAGWRCLNNFNYANIVSSNGTVTASNIKIWNNKHNSLIIDEALNTVADSSKVVYGSIDINLFNQYETKIKCIAKYQSVVVESEEYIIKNYARHNFSAVISSNSETNRLIFPEDKITLTCKVNDDNSFANSSYTKYYSWQIKAKPVGIENTYVDITSTELSTRSENVSIIHIKDDEKEVVHNISGDKLPYYYEFEIPEEISINGTQYGIEKIIVKVIINIDVDEVDNNAITLYSNEISIESMTDLAEEIKSTYIYKYYISPSMNVIFRQAADNEGGWNGDWVIYDENLINNAWIDLVDIEGNILEDNAAMENAREAYNILMRKIQFATETGNKYKNGDVVKIADVPYLYYTKKELLYIYKDAERLSLVEERNWNTPLMLRQMKVKSVSENIMTMESNDVKDSIEIDQINTFNQLTQNGQEDGIFYQENVYVITQDVNKIDGKTYYKRVSGTSEATYTYEIFTGEWSPNEVYYELSDSNKLYINATYINTGTLRVGSDSDEKFYASIHNPNVRIGGYIVNAKELISSKGTVGINSDDSSIDNIAFWAGDKDKMQADFRVTHGGKLYATGADIQGNFKITSYTDDTRTIATKTELQEAIADTEELINEIEKDLQAQIDGEITSWFAEGEPTKDNYPANEWTTETLRINHNGDLYYDADTGACYRWEYKNETNYGWIQIADEEISKALADAAAAQATADGKKRIFYGTTRPTPPYDLYDAWMQGEDDGEGRILICTTARENGTGADSDWSAADDSASQKSLDVVKIIAEAAETQAQENGTFISTNFSVEDSYIYMGSNTLWLKSNRLVIDTPHLLLNCTGGDTFVEGAFAINTDRLKLNHNGTNYLDKYFKIDTDPLKLTYSGSNYSLVINTDNFDIDSFGNTSIKGDLYATSLTIDSSAKQKNLAALSKTSFFNCYTSQTKYNNTYSIPTPIVKNYCYTACGNGVADGGTPGLKIDGSIFEKGKSYILSFKIKALSITSPYSAITKIGGHSSSFATNKIILDGNKITDTNFSDGFSVAADTSEHFIKIYLTRNNTDSTDNNLYIQPNHNADGNLAYFQVWDLLVCEGTIDMVWEEPIGETYGENILEDKSQTVQSNTSYPTGSYNFKTTPIEGEMYTITLKGTFGTGTKCFAAYNSGDYINLGILEHIKDGIYQITSCFKNSNNGNYTVTPTVLNVYAIKNDGVTVQPQSTIEWITMQSGIRAIPKNAEIDTFFKVDPTNGNIVLKAANTLSLAGNEIEITSGNFQLTKNGYVVAKNIDVISGEIGDWRVGEFTTYDLSHSQTGYIMYGPSEEGYGYSGGLGNYTLSNNSSTGILFTTRRLHGYFLDDGADMQRTEFSFSWEDLAKIWSRQLGFKYGSRTVEAPGNSAGSFNKWEDQPWKYVDLFTLGDPSEYYYVFVTANSDLSTAMLDTCVRRVSGAGKSVVYQAGVKRSSNYTTQIDFLAIPVSFINWS